MLAALVSLVVLLGLSTFNARAQTSPGWTVHPIAVPAILPMSPNRLANPGFEDGPPGSATGWFTYGSGYTVDAGIAHTGNRSVRLVQTDPAATHGAWQSVVLNQTTPRPIYFAGWSRAEGVTGSVNSDYSIYLDIYYQDGTPLWGQTVCFDVGSHDWQFLERIVIPAKPIHSISVYVLLRNNHAGTAWFDDLTLNEVLVDLAGFDDVSVVNQPPADPPFAGSPTLTVATQDGLTLELTEVGGAITSLQVNAQELAAADRAYASGFFVRDVAAGSDFIHFGGTLVEQDGAVWQDATDTALGLRLQASFGGRADRIAVDGQVEDLTGADRAISVYFALPLDATGWTWGDDVRTARTVTGPAEFRNVWTAGLGANGTVSLYPWGELSGPAGLALSGPFHKYLSG
jgi:hypothetical protein